jgi:hypothetical protein
VSYIITFFFRFDESRWCKYSRLLVVLIGKQLLWYCLTQKMKALSMLHQNAGNCLPIATTQTSLSSQTAGRSSALLREPSISHRQFRVGTCSVLCSKMFHWLLLFKNWPVFKQQEKFNKTTQLRTKRPISCHTVLSNGAEWFSHPNATDITACELTGTGGSRPTCITEVLKIQATERNRMHGEAKGRFTLLGYYFHIATTSWYQTSLPRIDRVQFPSRELFMTYTYLGQNFRPFCIHSNNHRKINQFQSTWSVRKNYALIIYCGLQKIMTHKR